MIRVYRDFKYVKNFINNSTIAIGNFDGMHFGHMSLLKKAKEIAHHSKTTFIILLSPLPSGTL